MRNYYFTYGSGGNMPFIGGWTRVEAEYYDDAINKFIAKHPCRASNTLDCAFAYTESEFEATSMYKNGCFDKFEQEVIK